MVVCSLAKVSCVDTSLSYNPLLSSGPSVIFNVLRASRIICIFQQTATQHNHVQRGLFHATTDFTSSILSDREAMLAGCVQLTCSKGAGGQLEGYRDRKEGKKMPT
eukprot:m.269393 g.269393  ORF g.269393 m.269393 type:complete len:106 (-) comp77857_c0_seq1:20-337(-)